MLLFKFRCAVRFQTCPRAVCLRNLLSVTGKDLPRILSVPTCISDAARRRLEASFLPTPGWLQLHYRCGCPRSNGLPHSYPTTAPLSYCGTGGMFWRVCANLTLTRKAKYLPTSAWMCLMLGMCFSIKPKFLAQTLQNFPHVPQYSLRTVIFRLKACSLSLLGLDKGADIKTGHVDFWFSVSKHDSDRATLTLRTLYHIFTMVASWQEYSSSAERPRRFSGKANQQTCRLPAIRVKSQTVYCCQTVCSQKARLRLCQRSQSLRAAKQREERARMLQL